VAALDYFVIVAVGLTLLGTALFASYWPARRASLTDPVAALRTQ
jgi:ABC-type lipoprotein release transport system permease subunit